MKNTNKPKLEDNIVEKNINQLENEKAVGPDTISNEMIKEGGKSMRRSIIRMMKIIYKKEQFPKDWNKAHIKIYIQRKRIKERNEQLQRPDPQFTSA